LLGVLIYCLPLGAQDSVQTLRLLFAGDLMQHETQLKAAYNPATGSYDYSTYYQYVQPLIEQADIAVANLEVTLAGKPYTGYPHFCAPDEFAREALRAGFDLLITANNHSCDKGLKGIIRTLDVLDDLGIAHTGTFHSRAERDTAYPLLLHKNGFSLALLNYTYGINGNPVPAPAIVNLIDTAQIAADLAKARALDPDLIIVTMHWGVEYQRLPSAEQKELADFCFACGADLVIGSHPHVIQPMERKTVRYREKEKEVAVYYSLGNFISNQRRRYTNGGAMAWVEFRKNGDRVELTDARYLLTWVFVDNRDGKMNYYIMPGDSFPVVADSLALPEEAAAKSLEFFTDSRQLLGKYNRGVQVLPVSRLVKKPDRKKAKTLYGVQVFASTQPDRGDVVLPEWNNRLNIVRGDDGLYRYIIGPYLNREIAAAFRKVLQAQGVSEAFVVPFPKSKLP